MLIKAFRLFVSSTFSDFGAERELLQSKVFPALDAYCAAKGYQFHPLDLRWGVNEEAQLDQRTAEICLGEVRAAKDYPPPNFLIMIGDRYGWVPLPYAIARDEFEAVIAWLESRSQHDAVYVLGTLYQHDDNHLVPHARWGHGPGEDALISAYTLRSREDDLAELKPAETWVKIEDRVRGALQEAADHLLRDGRFTAAAREKYFLSLTEQEIIHGLPGYSHGAETATASAPSTSCTDGPQAIAFIREITGDPGGVPASATIEQDPRVAALEARIRRVLSEDCIVTARATRDATGALDQAYPADFAANIHSKLQAAIDKHIGHVEAAERAPDFALVSERGEHRTFAEQKLEVFVGRESNLAAIARHITGGGHHPLVLHGRSGLGKSALMARAINAAERSGAAAVIYRFIGASAGSSDLRSLLVSLIEDLAAHGIARKPDEFEQDANKFNNQIEELLSSITEPVIIFLDALDQLRKPYRLDWLPEKLPTALKLVLSVLDDEAYEIDSGIYRSLRQRLPPDAFLDIEPLRATDARDILIALERHAGRRLQDGQRHYIIG